jgi:hypothetical protein
LLFILLFGTVTFSQEVTVNYQDEYLNEILLDLNQKYGVQVSIDSKISSKCKITVRNSYAEIGLALQDIASKCGLIVTKVGPVYTFSKNAQLVEKKKPQYIFQGEVRDAFSKEPLPFSKIYYSEGLTLTDENGKFSFKSFQTKEHLQIKYLGYEILDTQVVRGADISIGLKSSPFGLKAVVVENIPRVHLSNSGELAGNITFNDVTTAFVPGNSSNKLFNYLRLQPGVMAAGESLSNYVIWGSYPGQNQIVYDGITLYNTVGYNDDIGRVNPLVIKNMELYKGGYNVDIGDRSGAVLLIDSKVGNPDSVVGEVNITNQITAGYLSIPLFKGSSSIQLAGRKSYYQFLELGQFAKGPPNFIEPEFEFSDYNLKFSTAFKNGDILQISSIGSLDQYSESLDKKIGTEYIKNLEINAQSIGNSINYVRDWSKGGITSFNLSHSHYYSRLNSELGFKPTDSISLNQFQKIAWENNMREYSLKVNHSFPNYKKHKLHISAGFVRNEADFGVDSSSFTLKDASTFNNRVSAYVKDDVQWTDWFKTEFGIKGDYLVGERFYFQPRITSTLNINDNWNINLGLGDYAQFVSKAMIFDEFGNVSTIWQVADGKGIPTIRSGHAVLGTSYLGQKIEFGLEGYAKLTGGLARFYTEEDTTLEIKGFSDNAETFGGDAFIKARINKHELWLTYSIGQTMESFVINDTFRTDIASHSQLHEVKGAAFLNFHPFYASVNYVWGSGFQSSDVQLGPPTSDFYSRLDVAFQYKFRMKYVEFETGFSILNVLNQKNARLSQFAAYPDGAISSTRGVHFTPSIFFNIRF